jgi:proteasome lid subunit RPN8/RPN11
VSTQPSVVVDSEVVRKIRQHARSSSKTEICGVLIGRDRDLRVEVTALVEGENADQAGAHVTFTQDTWEHIYAVKDKEFPNERIVGWYHSHPGFGIFLSEHDTFIHKNFFSSPGQIAWVFDPISDEEGCFGWVDDQIQRLTRISVLDPRGGELAEAGGESQSSGTSEPIVNLSLVSENLVSEKRVARKSTPMRTFRAKAETSEEEESSLSLEQLVSKVFFSLALLALGGMLSWYFFPHIAVMPVVVDPISGKLFDPQTGEVVGELKPDKNASVNHSTPEKTAQPVAPNPAVNKGDNAKP